MNVLLDTTIKLVRDFELENLDKEGQNFLIDENLLNKEIESADLNKKDVVLDIGAGFGYITERAAKLCNVVAIEKDFRLYSYLVSTFELNKNVVLINNDITDMILPKFTKIVSNPPYNIVDRILLKISRYEFVNGVMILPNTLANSLTEGVNETVLSFSLKQFMDFKVICEVEKDKFYPPPRITSKMVWVGRRRTDIVQKVLDRSDSLVKNAILEADSEMNSKTKRNSKDYLLERISYIEDISRKTIKQLNLKELSTLVKFIRDNY